MLGSMLGQAAQTFTITDVVNVPAMAAAVATAGGVILLSVFGVGGGFRLAKRGFAWLFGAVK